MIFVGKNSNKSDFQLNLSVCGNKLSNYLKIENFKL